MDLCSTLKATSISTQSTNDKSNEPENALIVYRSKRAKFLSTYCSRQSFSLPDSYMFYILKHPKNAEMYQKMIKSCKYFFIKNPILVIPCLSYGRDSKEWQNLSNVKSDMSNLMSKIWITGKLHINAGKNEENILSSIISKVYRCDVKVFILYDQTILYHDLSRLIGSAEKIRFYRNVLVKNDNGSNVCLEKIVEVALKAKIISVYPGTILSSITSKTMKELLKIPHFSKVKFLSMKKIAESFDIETFYAYMKKNKFTKFALYFDESISNAYKNRLEAINNEILATKMFNYTPPLINFDGLDVDEYFKLFRICCSN
uniref:Uncharacterized protein n=1 Tax=Panagrolaimus davidi TaxID=227884 RepID=A0A914P464_9BILA